MIDLEKVSVIVPVYNAEKFIKKCIESIIDQTYTDIELILIDDGSKDRSGGICDEYAAEDSRIKVVHKVNDGALTARNIGLDTAEGQYIVFVDSDDYIDKRCIETFCRYMEDDVDVVIANANVVTLTGVIKNEKVKGKRLERFRLDKHYNFSGTYRHFTAWGAMYRRSAIGNVRFEKDYRIGEDTLFYYTVLRNCREIQAIPDRLYFHVLHEDSVTGGKYEDRKYTEISAWEKICGMFEDMPEVQQTCFGEYALRCMRLYFKMEQAGLEKSEKAVHLLCEIKKYRKQGFAAASLKDKLSYVLLITLPPLHILLYKKVKGF